MGLLSETDIDVALRDLDGWVREGDAITRTYEFETFGEAIDFMAACVPTINQLDHHPEWSNVYNRVEVRLTSHDAGGVTERDLRLARALDLARSE
jgi:4a-hydroxytetrahydrobiopterin dehydratase